MKSELPSRRSSAETSIDHGISIYRKLALPVASSVSFTATIVLAAFGSPASATVTGVLFLGTLIFTYLPSFSSFKVWGLEGKLRETIKEADEAIDRLTDLAKLFSKQAYSQIAYSGWLEGIPKADRPQLISELDHALTEAGLSERERIALRQPVISVSLFSLAYIFQALLSVRVEKIVAALRIEAAEIQKQGPIDMRLASGQRFDAIIKRQREIHDLSPRFSGSRDPRLADPQFKLAQLIPPGVLPPEDERKLEETAARIDALMALTRVALAVDPEVERFIDTYERGDSLHREVFGE